MNNNKSKISCKRVKNECHAEFISASTPLIKTQKEEQILNQVQDDNKRGFTLIELLVVVLIIGILAAVAVPQYQKAVMKTRYAMLKNLTKNLAEAQEVYYLTNGTYATKLEDLDVSISGDGEASPYYDERYTDHAVYFKWGKCNIHTTYTYCYNPSIELGYAIFYPHTDSSGAGQQVCLVYAADTSNSVQAQICKSETGKTSKSYSYYY